jgi:hypothetical protein
MKIECKRTFPAAVICAAIVGAAVIGPMLISPRAAMAQTEDAKAQQPVTLNFESGDINSVLQALFKDIGANYSIDPDVHGTVTISMSNVGFLAALRSVMRANNPPLTFEYVDGVYHVRLKHLEKAVDNTGDAGGGTDQNNGGDNGSGGNSDDSGSPSSDDKRWYKIPIDHYDVLLMAKFVGGMDKKQSEVVPSAGNGTGGGGLTGGGGGMGGMGGGMAGGAMGGGMAGGIR